MSQQEEHEEKVCYKCNFNIEDNLDRCPNCAVWLKPNDLKWRKSFALFLAMLWLLPIIIAFFSHLCSLFK